MIERVPRGGLRVGPGQVRADGIDLSIRATRAPSPETRESPPDEACRRWCRAAFATSPARRRTACRIRRETTAFKRRENSDDCFKNAALARGTGLCRGGRVGPCRHRRAQQTDGCHAGGGTGAQTNTAVYKANLDTLTGDFAAISISDASGSFGGASGQFSGFDLDAIELSCTDCADAACANTAVAINVFNFVSGLVFSPGSQRAPVDAKRFGTGAGGNTVNNGEVAGSNISIERNPVPVVPEPSTDALMFGGLAALGWLARRQRRAA